VRERHRPGQDAERAEGPPEPPLPPELVLGLHPAAGNARISRMLARQAVDDPLELAAERGTEIPPHAPDDMSGDVRALADGPGGLAEAFGGELDDEVAWGPETTIRADTEVPAQADPVEEWLKKQPASNADMAAWLLAGEKVGFVSLRPFYRQQMADIRDGKPDVGVITDIDKSDPKNPKPITGRMSLKTTGAPLGALTVLTGLTRARAERWVQNPAQPKDPVDVGDMIRNLSKDAHSGGASVDLFPQFGWTDANGPSQVIQVLQDLPKGSYTIGLPMQGQFFPKDQYLASRQEKSIADAGPGGTPKDITAPSLVYWTTVTYTSRYDSSKGPKYPWQDVKGERGVIDRLRSAPLKDAIHALAAKGIAIDVMPDWDNHIHVTRN
jgi:hypothetical protein